MSDWKQSKCGECEFWIPGERPRQLVQGKSGVLMDGPRNGVCREGPPCVVVVGGQKAADGGVNLVTQGMYPPVSDVNPACSRFVKALNLVEA